MYIDFSKLFHRASKDISKDTAADIRMDVSKWPEAWKTLSYKIYELLPVFDLSKTPPHEDPGLFSSIITRTSARDFSSESVTKEELSTLLRYSCGEIGGDGSPRRAQPSGGPQYPIEAYVLVFHPADDLPAGVYHYNVRDHALECIHVQKLSKTDIEQLFAYSWVQGASAVLILTSVFSRTKVKYGQRGYRYALLEAGHIGQNVYLVSGALGIKCCGMGGSYDIALERLLDVDGEHESVLYTLALGK